MHYNVASLQRFVHFGLLLSLYASTHLAMLFISQFRTDIFCTTFQLTVAFQFV